MNKTEMVKGKLVISFDFELFWGMRDKKTIAQYGANILGVQQVIPRLLEMFEHYGIKASFATVGFIFFDNKQDLLNNLPTRIPKYINEHFSSYNNYLDSLAESQSKDLYHFAPNLIQLIKENPGQEIATHTFSHYYCLEAGQNIDDFKADLIQAIKVAAESDIKIRSLVFPRNQVNNEYLKVAKDLGIICYRGNGGSWLYQARGDEQESLLRKGLRLIDAYFNLSGHNCYTDQYMLSKGLVDIPASRFLRPWSKSLRFLDGLRWQRIKNSMTYAAKNNLTYHLWWHPHNFGVNQKENFDFLEKILKHYQNLNKQYNFQSYNMSQLANLLKHE